MYHQKQMIGSSETIEVPIINNTARSYKFSDNETALQNVVLEGIAVHLDTLGYGKSGRTCLPLANMKHSFLTLRTSKAKERNKELPLDTLIENDNKITWFKPFLIDVPKCELLIPDSTSLTIPTTPVPGYTVVFTFFYRAKNDNDKFDADGILISA